MLRIAASRVPPLVLRLRDRACYFTYYEGGGLVNDTTPVRPKQI